jgi:hypothetical protein
MTRRDNVLRALENAGERGCTTAELTGPECGGSRFGGRIGELRQEGWIITERRVREGSHLYVLTGREAVAPRQASVSVLKARKAALVTHRDGFEVVQFCPTCVETFRQGHACPHGHVTEEWLTGTGATAHACRHNNIDAGEIRHAA